MDDPADRFIDMHIAATSPDGSVTATFSYSDGVRVALHPDRYPDHDGPGLAEQVALAISRLREQRNEVIRRVLPHTGRPESRRWQQDRRDRLFGEVSAEATSTRHRVLLRITGGNHVACEFRPDTLTGDRPDREELAEDIRQAYHAAGTKHRRAVMRINKRLLRQWVRGEPVG